MRLHALPLIFVLMLFLATATQTWRISVNQIIGIKRNHKVYRGWKKQILREQKANIIRIEALLSLVGGIGAEDGRPSFMWDVKAELKSIIGTPPPKSGDWIINDTTIVEDSVLIINGSIIINETGTLVLKNTSIYMNLSHDGEYWIDVYGNLTMLESLVTAYNTSNNYYIDVFSGAKLRIDSSEISYAGYEWEEEGEHSGLWINTSAVTIENTKICHNYYGVTLVNSSNSNIYGNTIQNCVECGIAIGYSNGNSIRSNTIQNNSVGVAIAYSNDNCICDNLIQNNSLFGLYVGFSDANNISNNVFLGDGAFFIYSYNNTVENNTVNGKPLVYLENQENKKIDWKAGQIILVGCRNIEITNQNISSVEIAIEFFNTNQTKVHDSTIQNNTYGIYLQESYGNQIYDNTIQGNIKRGIELDDSSGNSIYYNTIQYNGLQAIDLINSNGNNIFGNTIQNNSWYGIYLGSSSNNRIFFNNFINNTPQHIDSFANNTWYTEKNITYIYKGKTYSNRLGNYWDNYTGSDPDGDGIGNETYMEDRFPLVEPTWKYEIGDSDHDDITDIVELGVYGTDPNNGDTDNDGLPDGWEIEYSLNPTDPWDSSTDPDEDNLINLQEYQHGTNPINPDTDSDGLPDGWEVMYSLDPTDSNDALLDMDGDGLTNLEEQQHSTNPILADTDGDGMPDGWEVSYGFDPVNSSDGPLDVDGDGLANCDEFRYGTDPYNNDTDGDGFDDGFEVRSGTNPNDPNDFPSPFVVTETMISISTVSYTSVVSQTVVENLPVYALTIVALLALLVMALIFIRRKTVPST